MAKDDLTGIEEYSKKSQETGTPAPSDNDLFPTTESSSSTTANPPQETPHETIDDFAPIGATDELHDLDPGDGESSQPALADELPDLSQDFTGGHSHAEPLEGSSHALDNVRKYAERITAKRESVPAAYPFSVLIEGNLRPEEREKLLDVLAREGMGIREVDIEPQFESGRVLIPRISEYAAVLLIQALRGMRATIKAGPSDEIFSTPDTRDEASGIAEPKGRTSGTDTEHPAETLPITAGPSVPWITNYKIVGVLTASATLKSTSVETESSSEYLELLESLQRELRYRAHHKGATAILNYSIQLTALQLSSHYRVTVSGTAIKN